MCTSAPGRGRLPLVQVVRLAELEPRVSCIAAMLAIPLRVAEVAIPQHSARALSVDREVAEVRRSVRLSMLEEAALAVTVTPVARGAATLERIREAVEEAEPVRWVARQLGVLPPLLVRVEQAARRSSTGRRTQAVAVAVPANHPMQ